MFRNVECRYKTLHNYQLPITSINRYDKCSTKHDIKYQQFSYLHDLYCLTRLVSLPNHTLAMW
ncbi:hypothetical protein, partial [Cuspidothrix issatschenkoi]|uniref:hypothetical protein n=1 Tax=Cuspidothrix issatschenkoi TaxID=230752 RepID=UPI001A9C3A96